MVHISEIVELISGTPQFRIMEVSDSDAPVYAFYGQSEIEDDLISMDTHVGNKKQIKTFDTVNTVATGDVIFSLISGKAAIVQSAHSGYLFTQNYVKLVPSSKGYTKYLVYLINEDTDIRHQLQRGQQGSTTLKYTIRQLSGLVFPTPPSPERQEVIGGLYFNQLRLAALKGRAATTETTFVLGKIKGANRS